MFQLISKVLIVMAPVRKIAPKSFPLKKNLKKKSSVASKSFSMKKNLKNRSSKRKSAVVENRRGAVFFSNLPHGFYERALDAYLRQFGDIHRIKIAKSLKNAKPMGYGYVEFEHEKVALIVAKTMNNYLMFKKLLKCQFISNKNLNSKMWASADITPELCPGTINKRKSQYLLESGSSTIYSAKKQLQAKKLGNFLKNTLGLKLAEDGEKNERAKKIRMELDDNDEEISIKTPPNVVKIIKKNNGSKSVRPVLCDGDATTVKKAFRKRSSTSLEPVSKELFNRNKKGKNNNKKLKLDSNHEVTLKIRKGTERNKGKIGKNDKTVSNVTKTDVNSSKHKENISKRKSLCNVKQINNIKEKGEVSSENTTALKQRRTPKSLKKVIEYSAPCSANEENFALRKARNRQRKVATNSSISKISSHGCIENTPTQKLHKKIKITPSSISTIEKNSFENTLKNKTPKSSKKGCKDILGKITLSPSSLNVRSNVNKKILNSSMKVTPAGKCDKVLLNGSNDKIRSKDKRNRIQLISVQSKKNRRVSLSVKKAVNIKTPKTNCVRSKEKIQLPVSV